MVERRRKKLGEILLSQGMLTQEQLLVALQEHKRTGVSLGVVLVKMGFISDDDLSSVLGEQIQLNQKKRIGEVLLEQGLITEEQLQAGLMEQRKSGMRLGKCLTKLGFISENKLVDVLSAQLDVQHVVLENFNFSRDLIRLIPEDMARKYKVIPLFDQNDVVTVAMSDPTNLRTIDHLKFKLGKEVDPVIATEKSIVAAIDKNYSSGLEDMTKLLGEVAAHEELDVIKFEDESDKLSDEEGAQVIKLVNLLINQAVSEGASDIHIEPLEKYVRLRYRIDGELVEKNPIPLLLRAQITSRLKIMSGMDIAEKRKPQDGRFQIRFEGREVDLRVSSYPVMTRTRGVNEKIVMRVLDPYAKNLTLDKLGFLPKTIDEFEKIINLPDGIILVTGPTGSGKSSTLYAALQKIYDVSKNIVTMEDPVEYNLDGICQGQINPKAGFSFADGMRSILRQDPDIIMIGEMRDLETCQMAIQAALTGHLVFSTLHTNDSASAYTRLLDMGMEPFLVTSTIVGILAQRLVRRLCQRCREPYTPEPELLSRVGLKQGIQLFRGKGCKTCNGTGYKGRLGIYELLIPDANVSKLVSLRSPAEQIKSYLLKRGDFDSLRRDGLRKVLEGLTTIDQVLGATQNDI
ncbi:MAG: Flp pilus assembly complex ATPase component TadA [Fibrobacter sp.]|nr:Flp pilus assembly complex ATPase component TadA [Fibrobacter sp.]